VAGALDGTDAIVFSWLVLGVAPMTLFQYIASGVLGTKSFSGGWYAAALGIGLHFLVAVGAAGVYYAVSIHLSGLFRKPYVYGPAFGMAVYFFMHYLVIPLSAVPKRTISVSSLEVLNLVIAHTLFVGLPIALIARRSAASPSNTAARSISRVFHLKKYKPGHFQISEDPFFGEKVWDIVGLYLNPPDKVAALCVDEKVPIKTSEPNGLGYVEGVTHNHVPVGTTTLPAALNLVAGTMIAPCPRCQRHEEYLRFLQQLEANIPNELTVHLIVEKYATHKHPQIQCWLAAHRSYHLHFMSSYSLWLNQIEMWFNIIAQTTIRGIALRRAKELTTSIDHFVRTYDAETSPFVWTATADSILEKMKRLCQDFPANQRRDFTP